MAVAADMRGDYGVKPVADQLHERLRRYLEAQYHIRDTGIIEERRALLQEAGTVGQRPYLETTPTYELGDPYAALGLPSPIGETLAELAKWEPRIGIFARPYVHQAQALQAFFNEGRDLIVATGTGSGKTETFLWPILGHILLEAAHRSASFRLPGCRALLLYPMNALVSDQVARLRRLFGDERLSTLFQERYGRFPRFGMYTSRTPYPGPRRSKKDRLHLDPVLRYYLKIEDPDDDLEEEEKEELRRLKRELQERGRWPAKDLRGFYGRAGARWAGRLQTQPGDRELMTRHEMQQQCPDILVTNYSMLEYMLLRPIERPIFRQTREWLEGDERNELILVLDEAHLYRGAGGAEVALLIRRLQARLGIPRERLRCILTSASLGSGAAAEEAVKAFAVGLTGHPEGNSMPFRVIRGQREQRPPTREGTRQEAERLASFDLPAFFRRAEAPADAVRAIADLGAALGWPDPPAASAKNADEDAKENAERALRRYLYDRLHGFGPIELLIAETAGNATAFEQLARRLFPDVDQPEAEQALSTLLALGTYAHNGDRALLPTRVHLLFRGLPSLYACINPRCDQRRYRPGEPLLLGRLYTEPRTRCTCALQARVYELYTHRDCGAAFLRVFGRGPDADFYWHEQGGDVEHVGAPLDETFLLVESPHPAMCKEVGWIWLDMSTGRVQTEPPDDPNRYRRLCRPARPQAQGATQRGQLFSFEHCPACTKQVRDKIMDLATKGEQPFANLVREQLVLQPATKPLSEQYPNGGRKELLFSDGRQKAARLARDLPREVEFDSFRQALALAVQRLTGLGSEATLNERLYVAFISVCSDFFLHFFDREGRSQEQLIEHVRQFREFYDADLQAALEEEWRPTPPPRYDQALLRQLADPFYSLYAACAAVVQPSRASLRKLDRQLAGLPEAFRRDHLKDVATAWIQVLLDRTAFNPQISEETRRRVSEYFRPIPWHSSIRQVERLLADPGGLSDAQTRLVREQLYGVLTSRDSQGHPYLDPSGLVLVLALEDAWHQCASCGLTQHRPVLGRCASCGGDRLEALPPDHPYMTSRKGYFREPLRSVLAGARPVHLTAEEHTAQLSQRDAGVVYATTEEFELRFQDVPLGPDKPPVDVLSCTTTMEVGIDIGSLTAVGLRNVPPQRENYQQRSGRAGRRGAAVSTVVTYAQGGPHDNYYYHRPEEIISGEPREPKVKVDNRRLARRHIHSFLIQTFFNEQLDRLPPEEQQTIEASRTHLMSALGAAADFFGGEGPFSLPAFRTWVKANVIEPPARLADDIARWLPDELCTLGATDESSRVAEKRAFAAEVAQAFVSRLDALAPEFASAPRPPESDDDDEGGACAGANGAAGSGSAGDTEQHPGLLLNVLFDQGLLPSYAFPTDLCTFYVFEYEGDRVRIKERPQQGKSTALSEYAPGRLLVVNKQTYRVGGIYVEGTNSATPGKALFGGPLGTYVYCPLCTYVREEALREENELCPVCHTPLRQWELLDPPGFSPERGLPLSERDRDQDISYATAAQFPTPIEPDRFAWRPAAGRYLRYAYEQDRRLVTVNKGPDELGFRVCESCGAAWPASTAPTSGDHLRPFLLPSWVLKRQGLTRQCSGPLHPPLYLGYAFRTDLLLLRIALCPPLAYNAQDPWLHDALRTAAEAIALAATRRLDIDPGELSAGYRLMAAVTDEDPGALGLTDVYLFDTASGGAGYAAEAGDILSDVLQDTLDLLRNCPESCERSCTKCLRHYGNRYWHERLDRHLAAQLVAYARDGVAPSVPSIAEQGWQLTPLHRYLELEGWDSQLGTTVGGVDVPLLVKLPDGGRGGAARFVAVGTYPALLDRNADEFVHPLQALDSVDEVDVVLLNDYVVTRDLPTAYQQFRRDVGAGGGTPPHRAAPATG
jgi:ATP-dependent helicase YprA (DUF1998 family)